MAWVQRHLQFERHEAGIHLITPSVIARLPELSKFSVGILHLHLLHTSAALGLNEAVEPEVRSDIHHFLAQLAPEDHSRYTHTYEGPDDMPAHIKSLLVGPNLTVPIEHGNLALGRWQGIYLCEFRRHARPRTVVATIHGKVRANVQADVQKD